MCDAHRHQMELATLPDNVVKVESTTIEKAIHSTLRYAGFDARWQDKLLFKQGGGSSSLRSSRTSRRRCHSGRGLSWSTSWMSRQFA